MAAATSSSSSSSSSSRLQKSLSEKMRLMEASFDGAEWSFQVRGIAGTVYEQHMANDHATCTCPDHQTRHTFCKHLLFLVARVACQMELAGVALQRPKTGWSAAAYEACHRSWLYRLQSTATIPAVFDDDCAICFEPVHSGDGGEVSTCVNTCHKSFHSDCMAQWLAKANTCPLCRSSWVSRHDDEDDDVKVTIAETAVAAVAAARDAATKETDVVLSFDTTGSMYSCLAEVRRSLQSVTDHLFRDIPGLRLAVMAHGDYCDGDKMLTTQDFTTDAATIKAFVESAPATSGGDYPECYELVLQRARQLSWRPAATTKCLILIGDAPPHDAHENPGHIDWRAEADALANRNIQVFSVQCLNRGNHEAYTFYSTVAQRTGGYHLFLDQFSAIRQLITAICFRQFDSERLAQYESDVQAATGGLSDAMRLMFDTMLGKKSREDVDREMHPDRFRERYHRRSTTTTTTTSARPDLTHEAELMPCPPAKYQVFTVDATMDIQSFCRHMGVTFRKGRGYYEFTKNEIVQAGKDIILMDRATGQLYEGDVARSIAGLPSASSSAKLSPTSIDKYRVFIQSTSMNRKLIAGQGFLYEAPL